MGSKFPWGAKLEAFTVRSFLFEWRYPPWWIPGAGGREEGETPGRPVWQTGRNRDRADPSEADVPPRRHDHVRRPGDQQQQRRRGQDEGEVHTVCHVLRAGEDQGEVDHVRQGQAGPVSGGQRPEVGEHAAGGAEDGVSVRPRAQVYAYQSGALDTGKQPWESCIRNRRLFLTDGFDLPWAA